MLSIDVSSVEFPPAILKTNAIKELQPYKAADPLVVKHLEKRRKCFVTPGTRSEYRDMDLPQSIALADELVKFNFGSLIEDLERPLIVDDMPLDEVETPDIRSARDQFKRELVNSPNNLDNEAYKLYQANILRRQNHMAVGIVQALIDDGVIGQEMAGMVDVIKARETAAYAPVSEDSSGGRTNTQKKIDFVSEYKEFVVRALDWIYGIERPVKVEVGIPVKVDAKDQVQVKP